MNYLLSQIFLCLLAAFILGFIIGWLWKHFTSKDNEVEIVKLQDRLANCKKDLAGYQTMKSKVKIKTPSEPEQIDQITDEQSDDDSSIPSFLTSPRNGKPDDLKRIKGIGKVLEMVLFEHGVFHFDQIAEWTPENAKKLGVVMKFPGRIEREQWISQATELAKGKETEFSKKVDNDKIYD